MFLVRPFCPDRGGIARSLGVAFLLGAATFLSGCGDKGADAAADRPPPGASKNQGPTTVEEKRRQIDQTPNMPEAQKQYLKQQLEPPKAK